jgi:hypothetical protein
MARSFQPSFPRKRESILPFSAALKITMDSRLRGNDEYWA